MSPVAMSDSQAFRAALIDSAQATSDHPDVDELVAYLMGELSGDEETRVSEHLVACRECASTVLDLEPLTLPEAPTDGVADFEREAAWRDLRARIFADERPSSSFDVRRWSPAIAASLLVATLGLSGWVAQLKQQVGELSQPLVNVPISYVDEVKRSVSDEEIVAVPAGVSHHVLIFTPAGLEEYPEYQVVFLDNSGREALRVDGLELSESAGLRLGLPRGALPAGEYQVRLSGRDGQQWLLLEEYRRQIVYLEAP